jgi:carbamoyltransferase
MYCLLPEGNYELAHPFERCALLLETGLLDNMRFGNDPFTRFHMDFAAGVQKMLETLVFHVLTYHQRITGESNLCLAGGVAHNCSLNGKILYSGLFENVFVQPAAHDAGGALGAALWALYDVSLRRPRMKLAHLYHGTDAGYSQDIRSVLDKWKEMLKVEEVPNIAVRTAQLLAKGDIVAWVQGRSEFGPRALGNRSILADPRPASNRTLINQLIKKREEFRPFAPSVVAERAADIFDLPPAQHDFPFMTVAVKVREEYASILRAVTHVDNTARIHTVSRESNLLFWQLLNAFGEITDVPVLLNTSFNNNAEPIVDTVDDAVTCFLTTELRYLVVGNFFISKKPLAQRQRAILNLSPALPLHRRLTRGVDGHSVGNGDWISEIRSTKSRFFGPTSVRISDEMFSVLSSVDGKKSLEELIKIAGIHRERRMRVVSELLDLWSRRFVVCLPSSRATASANTEAASLRNCQKC